MFRKSLIVVTTVFGLSACSAPTLGSNQAVASIGSLSEARALVPRGLTMDQVRAKLGRPSANRTMNNETTWVYSAGTVEMEAIAIFLPASAIRSSTKSVLVTFNSSGRVSRVEYLENSM